MTIKIYPQQKAIVLIGLLMSFASVQATFKFSGNKGTLAVDQTNSKLILGENVTSFSGNLKVRTAGGENIKSLNVTTPETITFSSGSLQMGVNQVDLTGCTYDPKNSSATDAIKLASGQVLSVASGSTIEHDVVITGGTPEIVGTPLFSSAITVDSGATLKLGIQHKLNKNISLDTTATLQLTDDLALLDAVIFTGAGVTAGSAIVDVNKYTLELGTSGTGAGKWVGTVQFKKAQDIQLNGPVTLDGTWKFINDGSDKVSVINGNGNVLDISGGGKLDVAVDHTLYLSDIHIKGFGAVAGSFTLADHATTPGTVVLSNVTIDLVANYTHSAGKILITGDNVRFIVGLTTGVGNPYTFTVNTVTNTRNLVDLFNVDGQVLIYETLGGVNQNPFYKVLTGPVTTFMTSADTCCTAGGVIRSAVSNVLSLDTTVGSNTTLNNNFDLFDNADSPGSGNAPSNRIVVTATATINGSNYAWNFPSGSTKVLKIASGATLTLTNVVLNNFSFDNVEFVAAASSHIQFDDGVVINLARDMTLPLNLSGNYKNFKCIGNVTIKGNGQTVTLNGDSAISQQTAAKRTTIDNLNLKIEHDTAIVNEANTAIVKLRNCNLNVKYLNSTLPLRDFRFKHGAWEIDGYCRLTGRNDAVDNGGVTVGIATYNNLKITTGSTLYVGRNVNLSYEVNTNLAVVSPATDERTHLVFEDYSSTLFLDGCTFTATGQPIQFTKGNLLIDNKVNLVADTAVSKETYLGTAVNTEILAAGILNIDGQVKYILTS